MTNGKHHEEEYRSQDQDRLPVVAMKPLPMGWSQGQHYQLTTVANLGDERRDISKPYCIAKRTVWEAYQRVKATEVLPASTMKPLRCSSRSCRKIYTS
jgi:hypothetical protein